MGLDNVRWSMSAKSHDEHLKTQLLTRTIQKIEGAFDVIVLTLT